MSHFHEANIGFHAKHWIPDFDKPVARAAGCLDRDSSEFRIAQWRSGYVDKYP